MRFHPSFSALHEKRLIWQTAPSGPAAPSGAAAPSGPESIGTEKKAEEVKNILNIAKADAVMDVAKTFLTVATNTEAQKEDHIYEKVLEAITIEIKHGLGAARDPAQEAKVRARAQEITGRLAAIGIHVNINVTPGGRGKFTVEKGAAPESIASASSGPKTQADHAMDKALATFDRAEKETSSGKQLMLMLQAMGELFRAMQLAVSPDGGLPSSPDGGGGSDSPPSNPLVGNEELYDEIQDKGIPGVKAEYTSEKNTLRKQIADPGGINAKIVDLDTTISTANGALTAERAKPDKPARQAKIAQLEEQVRNAEQAKASLEAQRTEKEGRIQEIVKLEADFDKSVDELKEIPKKIQDELKSAETQLRTFAAKNIGQAKELADLYGAITVNQDPNTLKVSLAAGVDILQTINNINLEIGRAPVSASEIGVALAGNNVESTGKLMKAIASLTQATLQDAQKGLASAELAKKEGHKLLGEKNNMHRDNDTTWKYADGAVSTTFQFHDNQWKWEGASGVLVSVPSDEFTGSSGAENYVNTIARDLGNIS